MSEHDKADAEFRGPKGWGSYEELPGQVTLLGITVAAGIILAFALAGCATTPDGSRYGPGGAESEVPDVEEKPAPARAGESMLGIRVEGLRLSAAGYVLDFRYRVIDAEKAAPLLDKKVRPYLLDVASGAQLGVPDTAKLGQLRTTGRNRVAAGRDAFIMFANPGRFVQAGNRMILVMGDFRIEDITVE